MFGGGNATNEPLMGGQQDQDDSASHGSSQRSLGGRSASSLLERIQQQRQRELAAAATTAGAASVSSSSNMSIPPHQIQVPQYGPSVMPGFGNSDVLGQQQQPYFAPSNGWNLVSPQSFQSNGNVPISNNLVSAEKSQMFHDTQTEMHHALLSPSSVHESRHDDQNYSISEYFLTFVKDIYGLFLRLHVVLRAVLVVGLLYLAVKLLFYV
jgi:hypothetical protein